MARIEGTCVCEVEGCEVHVKGTRVAYVDALTNKCRPCEIAHGERWGHHGAKPYEGTQDQGEHSI